MVDTTSGANPSGDRLLDALARMARELSECVDVASLTDQEALQVVRAAEQIKVSAAALEARAVAAFVEGRDADTADAGTRGDVSAREAGRQHAVLRPSPHDGGVDCRRALGPAGRHRRPGDLLPRGR